MRGTILFLALFIYCNLASAQHRADAKSVPLLKSIQLHPEADLYAPVMKITLMPKPHSGIEKQKVEDIRNHQEKKYGYKRKALAASGARTSAMVPPVMLRNFAGNGYNGGVPNDNDMAISNGEVICGVNNTTVWSLNQSTSQTYGSYNLRTLTSSLGLSQEEFDPKVIYDPVADRFILLCLNGFTPATSDILVGFSQGNTTWGAWNFYALPGNPLNNSLWTDFPMMAVTDKELFITANLLDSAAVSWQTGFNQTIIWQIRKSDGYNGNGLTTLLHSGINFGGSPIRNLCPVKGGSGLKGPDMYFLSNRNFSPANDSIFLFQITDTIGSANLQLLSAVFKAPVSYHMPVNADQPYVDKLAVNDARILGAFIENNKIQFTASTLDTTSGFDGIYYGMIDVGAPIPTINSWIYTSPGIHLAYPNVAYAGNGSADHRSVFSVLYSSSTINPSCGAVGFDGTSVFSPLLPVKTGTGFHNVLVGDERWGDYTGCQTQYNRPEYVWVCGSHSIATHFTRTRMAEISMNPTAPASENDSPQIMETEIFPNPGPGRFNLSFIIPSPQQITITLFDMSGKAVSTLYQGRLKAGDNEFSFNTQSLASGIYHLHIAGEGGKLLANEKLEVAK